MDRAPMMKWMWCSVCMERTVWARLGDGSWYCTELEHEVYAELRDAAKAQEQDKTED